MIQEEALVGGAPDGRFRLVAGINRRTLDDLRHWTGEATKVLVF